MAPFLYLLCMTKEAKSHSFCIDKKSDKKTRGPHKTCFVE